MDKGFYWAKSKANDDPWSILHFDGEEWWACGVEIPIDISPDTEVLIGPIEPPPSTN